jgi:hypothetical protein
MRKMKNILFATALLMLSACATQEPSPPPSPDWGALKIELEQMYKTDQDKRKQITKIREAARAKGEEPDKAEMAQLWQEIGEQDKKNQARVTELLDKHGWLSKAQVGSLAANAIYLVVQHSPPAMQEKYLPMMRQAAEAGELQKSSLALTEDRVLMRQNKPQLYGSQVKTIDGVDLATVADPDNLDSRRKAMGLEPICAYLERFVKAHGPVKYAPCVK